MKQLFTTVVVLGTMFALAQTPAPTLEIELEVLSAYATGSFDEGAAEIVSYDPASQRLFVVNSNAVTLDVFDLSEPSALSLVTSFDMTEYGAGANSVAVSDGVVAVAIENEDAQAEGTVIFLDVEGNLLAEVMVGSLPDMVAFTPDGSMVLVANEGEPNDDYTVDPEGSVSLIDLSGGVDTLSQDDVTTASFTSFNGQEETLAEQTIRVFGPGASVAQDFEPEYIAVAPDSSVAYAGLQENNAVAVIDIARDSETFGEVIELLPLGTKDHSQGDTAFDASNRDDAINIVNHPTLGLPLPDAIGVYTVAGTDYIVTANEGDSRDYDGFSEEERIADVTLDPDAYPNAAELQDEANLGRLLTTTTLGDTDGDGDIDQLYSYGTRSFSVYSADGSLVYDSGSDFERITAEAFPDYFNANNDENGTDTFDARSDDKGPEPEGLDIGVIGGETYAFIGLERIGGIMVYNVSDPEAPVFVQYLNNRDFEADAESTEAGDLGPEGVLFISADDSPTGQPLLVVGNEVSGSTTVYSITSGE